MHLLIRSQQRQPYPILCYYINYAGANRNFANGIPQIMPYQPLAQKVEQKPQRRWTRNDQKQEILPPQSEKFNLLSDNWQNSHRIWKQKRDEMKRKNAFGHHSSEMALLQQYIAADEGKNSKFPAKAAFSNMKSSSSPTFYPKQIQDQSSYNQQQNWQQPQRRMEETYEKFIPRFEYPLPQRRAPIGRLFNPQDEIRKIRTTMNHFLMEEYLRSNGSKESLDKILKWAERMRQKNLEKSPILAMIDKLNWRRETRPLIMPLYICFLKTPEAKMFKDRPELILPAIAHAFNAENPILAVNSISKKISKMMECYTPDGIETIRRFMQVQFRIFIHQVREQQSPMQRNSTAICAIKVKEMAAALRQSGCYPTPLTDTFVFPKLFDNASNDEWKMEMFKVFMEEPAERELFTNSKGKLFTARPNIFFPLLMEKFRNQDNDRWFLLGKMFYFLTNPLQQRQTTPMPNFIVEFVKDRLGKLFNISCKCGHFELAKRILDYNKRSEGKFDIYISPISLLKYWLHLWMNKRLLDARIIGEKLHERIYWLKESEKQSGKNQKQLEEWRNLQKRLNSMNKCFRELMDNPQTNDEEREKYAKLFIGVLRDQIS